MSGLLASRKPSFWLCLASVVVLSLLAVTMLTGIIIYGDDLTRQAYDSGQRLTISLSDGSISGKAALSGSEEHNTGDENVEDKTITEETVTTTTIEETPSHPEENLEEHLEKQNNQHQESSENEQEEPHPPVTQSHDSGPQAAEESGHISEDENAQPPPTAAQEIEDSVAEEAKEPVEEQPPASHQATPAPVTEVVEQETPLTEPAEVTAADILVRAPGKGLTERTPAGVLPIISTDGTVPWKFYARTQGWNKDKPWVVVIVTGLGLGRYTTEGAISLPPDFTLSFSPYARDIATWLPNARSRGHEVLLDLPVETQDYPAADPGPHALLIHIEEPMANIEALHWVLSRVQGAVGVLVPPDDLFSGDKKALKQVMEELGKRGLIYVHSNPAVAKVASDTGKSADVPTPAVDIIIDDDITPSAIKSQLAALEKLAVERGYAIGLAQRYPVTVKTLAAWEKELQHKGISLVPVSAIANDRF